MERLEIISSKNSKDYNLLSTFKQYLVSTWITLHGLTERLEGMSRDGVNLEDNERPPVHAKTPGGTYQIGYWRIEK